MTRVFSADNSNHSSILFEAAAILVFSISACSPLKIYDEATRLNDLADEVRNAHLERMKDGSCGALPALTFSDMAVALRRIKNHTVNLHEALFADPSLPA